MSAESAGDPVALTDLSHLVTAYYTLRPDPTVPAQRVRFGTSGHRGSSLAHAFNESHIAAITQAICDHRRAAALDGPLFLGIDTHALSEPAAATALEVLAANDVHVMIDRHGRYTPTPVISHAIITYNHGRDRGLADGIVVTPSHNPPEDGGFKYDPPNGGPAPDAITHAIETRANELLEHALDGVNRVLYERALRAGTTHPFEYLEPYVADLANVIDLDAVRAASLRLGVDPLGGAGVDYWPAIAERYGLRLTMVSDVVDATFRFVPPDHDGRIRMDPSSRSATERLVAQRDQFDVAWACDPDHDRHGVVVPGEGLLDADRYLAVAAAHLCAHRPEWRAGTRVAKTVVTSSLLERVAARARRPLYDVPVGFKWFAEGLFDGAIAFAGEESAGAAFVRRDGAVWTTDKDGIIAGLLAAEITAVSGHHPGIAYTELARELGPTFDARLDAPASPQQRARLTRISTRDITERTLAGDAITSVITCAPGNDAAIGGVKVITRRGWFAVRPSGTEAIYRLYAESSADAGHLALVQQEAQAIVARLTAVEG